MEISKIGPVGGSGGQIFGAYMIPDGTRLAAVHIYADTFIEGLGLVYRDQFGQLHSLSPVGIAGGQRHVLQLGTEEYVIGISGRCGWFVDSMRVHTNQRISDLFGGSGGDHAYALGAPEEDEVIGFFGNAAWYIDAVGLLTRPLAARAA